MTRRDDLYARSPEATEAHRQRCFADMREARARGWTSVEVSQIPEPPVPMGYPPEGHPRRARADEIQPGGGVVALPEYGDGDDGGYTATQHGSLMSEGLANLSPRQREVAELIAAGFTDKDIQLRLTLSYGTVRNYIEDIADRLGLNRQRNLRVQISTLMKNE